MPKKPKAEFTIEDLVLETSPAARRQKLAAKHMELSAAIQILTANLIEPEPLFGVGDATGDPAQRRAVIFRGQDAKDLLGAALREVTAKNDLVRAELENLGVHFGTPVFDVLGKKAPAANRKVRRTAKAKARR